MAIARQATSTRLPEVHTSRRALYLACRAIATVPHLSMVRSPGYAFDGTLAVEIWYVLAPVANSAGQRLTQGHAETAK